MVSVGTAVIFSHNCMIFSSSSLVRSFCEAYISRTCGRGFFPKVFCLLILSFIRLSRGLPFHHALSRDILWHGLTKVSMVTRTNIGSHFVELIT